MIANVQHWTELIAKKLSGNIRADEDRMLEAWIARDPEHSEYYQQLVTLWSTTGVSTEHPLPEADLADLEKRMSDHGRIISLPEISVPKIPVGRLAMRAIAAAAAILLLVVAGVTIYNRSTQANQQIVTEVIDKNVEEVQLPDGSVVFLRQGSTLTYNREFTERSLSLKGEAFFEVVPDASRPFTVSAGNGAVRVLGTKFNVKAVGDAPVELFVEEGRVAFSAAKQVYEAKVFTAGQAGVITTKDEVERVAPPGPNVSSWISGNLVFDHAPLNEVVRDLSRHYKIEIIADTALYICELKADFADESFADVLETLRFSLKVDIDTSGDTVLISGTPCTTPESEE